MSKTRKLTFLLMAAVGSYGTLASTHSTVEAGNYNRTGVWVYIYKDPSEDVWEACRHVYGRNVYQVRRAGTTRARCFVDASEVNNPQGSTRSGDAY